MRQSLGKYMSHLAQYEYERWTQRGLNGVYSFVWRSILKIEWSTIS